MKHLFKNTLQQAVWAPVVVLICYATAAKVFNAYILLSLAGYSG